MDSGSASLYRVCTTGFFRPSHPSIVNPLLPVALGTSTSLSLVFTHTMCKRLITTSLPQGLWPLKRSKSWPIETSAVTAMPQVFLFSGGDVLLDPVLPLGEGVGAGVDGLKALYLGWGGSGATQAPLAR